MTSTEILKELKAKKYRPIYFLQGEESYYIDLIADYIEAKVLSEGEKSFNQSVYYGKDIDLISIINAAKRYPMMAERQVIIIKEAQNIKKWDELAAYAEQPMLSTVLVFCHKYDSLDKRLKVAKVLEKNSVFFESKKLYDNQVPKWIEEYVNEKGSRIHAKASALISESLGNDLSKIANELDKLFLNIKEDIEINVKEVEENIGISKDYNVFELTNALGKKDVLKANKIINYFGANPKSNPMVMVLGTLANFFTKVYCYHHLKDRSKGNVASALKVNPFFVSDYETAARNYTYEKTVHIITLLKDYDLKAKGVDSTGNTDDGELLKELVFQVMH